MAHNHATLSAAERSQTFALAERTFLLHASRLALSTYFEEGAAKIPVTTAPALLEQRASFVTLRRRDTGELRGCRGECTPSQPLIEAVARMSLAAALDDCRFVPVTATELPLLRIEISVLSQLVGIAPSEVRVGAHGLLIIRGTQRGLLLPEVAIEHNMDRVEYLRAVCWKAGLEETAWQLPSSKLFAFETEAWEEE